MYRILHDFYPPPWKFLYFYIWTTSTLVPYLYDVFLSNVFQFPTEAPKDTSSKDLEVNVYGVEVSDEMDQFQSTGNRALKINLHKIFIIQT